MAAKSELGDMQAEHQREMEALLESVRHLSREHKLHQLIIDSFIPFEYQVRRPGSLSLQQTGCYVAKMEHGEEKNNEWIIIFVM